MVYSLTYRRPAHVSDAASIISEKGSTTDASLSSGSTLHPYGIPEALSFDRVISGGTCPPCTTRDFMNYLIYIEHAAENLQFYLWFRDYTKRFEALPSNEKALSQPAPLKAEADLSARGPQPPKPAPISPEAALAFKGTKFEPHVTVHEAPANPFGDDGSDALSALSRPSGGSRPSSGWGASTDITSLSAPNSHASAAKQAFESADVRFQPFTIQPFREEVSRIIATYISDGGARQLNLASKERAALLQLLATTTHPSAFAAVARTVEWSLRRQAHPNFIRWSICNGNRPRVIFARGLGIGGIVGGLLVATVLTISAKGRGWRALAAVPFVVGIATLFAAWKGMCVVLHGMHHRHLRPWELFADADEVGNQSSFDLKSESIESFGSSNSYEDEPWVARYEKRNGIRKIFDREVWVQEPALRQIQDTIALQAVLVALGVTAIVVGVFCAIPKGGFF